MEGGLLHHVDNPWIEVGLLSWNAWQPDCTSYISSPRHIELSQGSGHEDVIVIVRQVFFFSSLFSFSGLSLQPLSSLSSFFLSHFVGFWLIGTGCTRLVRLGRT
jgi:hypothetical protein